jgi:hypothetical protein
VVDAADGSTRFDFDLDCVLDTWPDHAGYGAETEQWYLFQPSGLVLTVRDDGRYSNVPGDEAQQEEAWLVLPR